MDKRLKPLMEYYKQNGTIADIKQKDEFEIGDKNVKIGSLVSKLRQDKKEGTLSQDRIELLDYMGMNWDGNNSFEENKKYFVAWYMKYKTLKNLTQYSQFEYGDKLVDIGEILINLRKDKKHNKLTDAQVEFLDMFDISWAPKSTEVAFASLVEYKEKNGSIADIKVNEVFESGDNIYNVGRQINHLRTRYNKGLLTDDEIAFFEDLGMVWSKSKNAKDETEEIENFENTDEQELS